MTYLEKVIKHLKTICTHKKWVFYYCCKAKIPFQGLVHDLSKFSPIEFFESVKYFQRTSSPIDACKKDKGWSNAWMHHKGHNPHHYEYWQDNFDNGGNPIDMPLKYKKELICDYLGAGRAYMKDNFSYFAEYNWWQNKKAKGIAMHPNTISFIDTFFTNCVKYGEKEAFNQLNSIRPSDGIGRLD